MSHGSVFCLRRQALCKRKLAPCGAGRDGAGVVEDSAEGFAAPPQASAPKLTPLLKQNPKVQLRTHQDLSP